MLIDGLDAAAAAFEVGYESASQFNCEYSRFFGQPPVRDIRALRSPGAPSLEVNAPLFAQTLRRIDAGDPDRRDNRRHGRGRQQHDIRDGERSRIGRLNAEKQ